MMKIMNAKEIAFFNKVKMVVEGIPNLVSKITFKQAREWKPEYVDGSIFKTNDGTMYYLEKGVTKKGYLFIHDAFSIYVSVKDEQGHQSFRIYQKKDEELIRIMYGGFGQFNQKDVQFYIEYFNSFDANELQEALVNMYIDFGVRVQRYLATQETVSTPSA